jgi:hypothetical protein
LKPPVGEQREVRPDRAGTRALQRAQGVSSRNGAIRVLREPEEVLLVDGLENRRDRLLDDFVL